MSPEEQRIAIAEFCKLPPSVTWKLPSSFVVDNEDRFLLPDFLNDLNACHEMEKSLDNERNILPEGRGFETQLDRYIWNLEIVIESACAEEDIYANTIKSTAAQRCEAFLKTMNLWKE